MRHRTRRQTSRLTAFFMTMGTLLTVYACGEGSRSTASPTHVILVTIDTLRADTLGFAGHPEVATPVLDRLAGGGRVFDSAHAHCVTTLPSHASILTGLYPHEHGVRHNGGYVLAETVPTLATLLQGAGFATAAFVGAFPLDSRFGLHRGFDTYDDEYGEQAGSGAASGLQPGNSLFFYAERPGDVVVRRAMAWWTSQRQSRRFLWLHLFDPHAPYEPPEPFASRFAAAPYLGEVSAVDFFLAPMLEGFLDGNEEPTLIVLTSDHGEALGEHGEQTHGLFAYESTLGVPLVLWGPGIEPGIDSRQARHIDIAPTVLEAIGHEPLARTFGRSLLAPADGHPRTTFFEALSGHLDFGWAPLRGVLVAEKKYIDLPIPELYDLRLDPREANNLFARKRSLANKMAAVLPEASSWLPERAEVSSIDAERLRSLGYLGGPTVEKSRYTAADDPKNLIELDRKVSRLADLSTNGQPARAIDLAHEILAERPTMGVVYIYLSTLLLQTGEYHEAIRIMQQARELGVAGRDLSRQLGLTLITVGRATEALLVLEPLADDPADAEAQNLQALALTYLGRYGEAESILDELQAGDEVDPRVHENRSFLNIKRERFAAARDAAQAALEIDPGLVSSWNNLGVALYNLDQRAAATDAWKRSLALAPNDYDTLLNLGMVEAQIGDVEAARENLNRFLEIAPGAAYEAKRQQARAILRDLGG